MVKLLVEAGSLVNNGFLMACEKNNLDIVMYLISKGANINVKTTDSSMTGLCFAAKNGYFNIVKILLAINADVNIVNILNNTPLNYACIRKHKEIIKILIYAGDDVIWNLLISVGIEVNIQNKNNNISLHIVCERQYLEIVKNINSFRS